MMFKILILQRLYNLSDDQMEFQINDRISFMRFLDLSISDTVPDAKTIWKFREDLKNANVIRKLFQKFNYELKKRGLIANEGSIIDATFVEVPRQRNTHEENEKIKNGEVPEEWQKPENAAIHLIPHTAYQHLTWIRYYFPGKQPDLPCAFSS